ncbi:protein-S-isoprenylcysteine O-methyltransferase [Xanthobacteraceae bacterium Astr-EGSB]|uniref:protein-S-isoprenylcysteine O-methyltransferase n=1 Tax=Astrobacterium formosum TaxID=3069710 RepID=UPI0027B352DA|nr:protein-S-isoprenylcysteine O-methyltransferase [Xanthobacteraceae bacterium Astr-EGSB]
MSAGIAKIVWCLGCVAWFVIRYPHARRARKTRVVGGARGAREWALLSISLSGLGVLPFVYVASGAPKFAGYEFQPVLGVAGTFVFAAALWLFYRTHHDLGRAWSVTLEIRERHALVTHGVYARVRHPMYSAFFLWAIAQALLLPNLVAGLAGLVGFGVLFAGRVGREEEMMLETFGDEYRAYMARTYRLVPGVY